MCLCVVLNCFVIYLNRFFVIILLSGVSDVFGASVAVDLVVDSSAKLDNVTDVDNSTSKSLNVSESISGPKIRDVDVILITSHSLFTVTRMIASICILFIVFVLANRMLKVLISHHLN